MKLVVITFGTEGDNRPLVALCQGLLTSGHEVLFLGERTIQDFAANAGVPFQALDGDMKSTALPGGVLHKLMSEGGHPGKMAKAIADLAAENTTSWMKSLLAVAQECDGIIFSGFTGYVALSVAEYLKVPVIGAGLFPVSPTKAFPSSLIPPLRLPGWLNYLSHTLMMNMLWRMFRQSINEARRKVCGQSARSKAWSDYPIVYGISPQLVPQPRDWPDRWRICGAWYRANSSWRPNEPLLEFLDAGDPPVYVGFGSMFGFDTKKLLKTLTEGLAGRRVLYSPGWSEYDASQLPDNVFILDETPHDWLFPRVSFVVHHGGAGTTHTAAKAGIPSIVIPFAGDQFFWGQRLAQAGVAPKPIPVAKVDTQRFHDMITQAETTTMRKNAHALAQAMETEDGVDEAVKSIERFIATH